MSLVQSVRKLAAKYPDTIYPSEGLPYCKYTEGTCGAGKGCIIGQGLQDCGMGHIAESADYGGEMSVAALIPAIGITNRNDHMWLIRVQQQQDANKTWATAVRFADRSLGAPA
jgi:hypothetical protein